MTLDGAANGYHWWYWGSKTRRHDSWQRRENAWMSWWPRRCFEVYGPKSRLKGML